jgi:GNAT superfamily N-acetyltransferase
MSDDRYLRGDENHGLAPVGPPGLAISPVGPGDLDDLLRLVRAYCEFYEVAPSDEALLALSRALISDPAREGRQWMARIDGEAVGFATVYWTWSTLSAARVGTLYDLYVRADVRRAGVARALLTTCLEACHEHGATTLSWQTALDNETAQRLYDRIGATREHWLDYWLPVAGA